MVSAAIRELRDQIRGISGALLVLGLTFHYTMETWHLGWTLPWPYLVGYAAVGLALITLLSRVVGFHRGAEQGSTPWWRVPLEAAEILMQSLAASYGILVVLGVLDLASSPEAVVRLGLIELVPLGFGAAMANRLFGSQDEQSQPNEGEFPQNVGVFAVGALFLSGTIAPTEEVELVAVHMDWIRYPVLVVLTLALVYLILYELEFRGQRSRLQQSRRLQVGTVFLAYAVGVAVSFLLLLGFGDLAGATVARIYQETLVLSFPASLGAAGAEVLL